MAGRQFLHTLRYRMARPHFASPALRTAFAAAAADFSLAATSSTPAACSMIKLDVGIQLAAWQTSPACRPFDAAEQSHPGQLLCRRCQQHAVRSSRRHATQYAASRCRQSAMGG